MGAPSQYPSIPGLFLDSEQKLQAEESRTLTKIIAHIVDFPDTAIL